MRTSQIDWETLRDSRLLECAFEAYLCLRKCHRKSSKIGKKKSQTPVDVPAVKKHEVFSTQDKFLTYDDRTLYIPIEPNRPGIGFVMPPKFPYQKLTLLRSWR